MSTTKIPGWGYLIESRKRLSESQLWEMLRTFYERRGPDAWTGGDGIPFWVTSNTFTAERYARVIHAALWDWSAAGVLDPSQPLNVLELASGSGMFAHHLLRSLHRLLAEAPPPNAPRPRVVMTDFTESNIGAWLEHEGLRPFVEQGALDFAQFDASQDGRLELRASGEVLDAAAPCANPLVVVASYLFDSLPQDAYLVQEGELTEWLLTLTSGKPEADLHEPKVLPRLNLHFEQREAQPYDDDDLDGMLETYRGELRCGSVLLPIVAVRCLRRLLALAHDERMLLLVADKGWTTYAELEGDDREPQLTIHGGERGTCFSLMVDFNGLGMFFARRGGRAFLPSQRDDAIKVAAYALNVPGGPWTNLALSDLIDGFNPNDLHLVTSRIEESDTLDLPTTLAILRLSRFDPRLTLDLWPRVEAWFYEAHDGDRAQVAEALTAARAALSPEEAAELPEPTSLLYPADPEGE